MAAAISGSKTMIVVFALTWMMIIANIEKEYPNPISFIHPNTFGMVIFGNILHRIMRLKYTARSTLSFYHSKYIYLVLAKTKTLDFTTSGFASRKAIFLFLPCPYCYHRTPKTAILPQNADLWHPWLFLIKRNTSSLLIP